VKAPGIYGIQNKIDGKLYVGSAVNPTGRFAVHVCLLRKGSHHSQYLQRAWARYGAEQFAFRILFFCDRDNLIYFEQRAIDGLAKMGHCLYNVNPTAGSSLGRILSEETRAKIGAKSRGRCLGRRHTAQELLKMSESNRGANAGRKHTAEARLAMSERRKGVRFSAAHRANLSRSIKDSWLTRRKQA